MTAPYAHLLERLRDPNFRGPMQHLRNWTQLDYMHDDAAKAIEALQADNERLRAMSLRLIDWIENEVGAELPFTDNEADLLATATALITTSTKEVTECQPPSN